MPGCEKVSQQQAFDTRALGGGTGHAAAEVAEPPGEVLIAFQQCGFAEEQVAPGGETLQRLARSGVGTVHQTPAAGADLDSVAGHRMGRHHKPQPDLADGANAVFQGAERKPGGELLA